MSVFSKEKIIDSLNLLKHPEGGWYCETYRSQGDVETERGQRQLATVIYFMLSGDDISAFHRLNSDEFWYYHQGARMNVHIIHENGKYEYLKLGPIGEEGSRPQLLLPAGCWFAADCEDKSSYSLISCSVHPGFDFLDFELAKLESLILQYPEYSGVIEKFCI